MCGYGDAKHQLFRIMIMSFLINLKSCELNESDIIIVFQQLCYMLVGYIDRSKEPDMS